VLIFSLLVWEWLVRCCVLSPAVIVHDSELGPMKAAHAAVLRTYEGYSRFTTDAFGFNNDPLPEKLPKQRLLILGDSFVEAGQVMRAKNFVSLLNTRKDVLVYNAGFAGADPRAFPVIARRMQDVLKPNLLVLCINADDLYSLNSAELAHHASPSGLKQWLQPVFAHSALFTHLNWKYKPELQAWWEGLNQPPHAQESARTKASMMAKQSANWQLILQRVRRINPHLLVVLLPTIAYGKHGAVALKSPASQAMLKVVKDMGVPALQTTQAFIRDNKESGLLALGFANSHLGSGHLNARGHVIVAKVISDYLAASHLL